MICQCHNRFIGEYKKATAWVVFLVGQSFYPNIYLIFIKEKGLGVPFFIFFVFKGFYFGNIMHLCFVSIHQVKKGKQNRKLVR